jgi:hypothetical protein
MQSLFNLSENAKLDGMSPAQSSTTGSFAEEKSRSEGDGLIFFDRLETIADQASTATSGATEFISQKSRRLCRSARTQAFS